MQHRARAAGAHQLEGLLERARDLCRLQHRDRHLGHRLGDRAMSTAWKSSLCSLATGAWPVMQRIGIESAYAEYSPVIMSVPAGPDVPMQTPMLPAAARV